MIYNNLNITIVEMIRTNSNIAMNNCDNQPQVIEKFSLEKTLLNFANWSYDAAGFNWQEYEQGLALGSYFWLHWTTQIPGGMLAMKYGTKLVFGGSNVLACWLCFLIPMASYWSYKGVILLRLLQGFITVSIVLKFKMTIEHIVSFKGLTWPSMHVMTAKWIPPDERSQFVTAYLGSSIGVALFHPIFGYMLKFLSWEWVFHLCGILGTLWWFTWLYYVYDSPAQHPRILNSERNYIEEALGTSVRRQSNICTPWNLILTSQAFWMNVLAQWGSIWGFFTLMAQAPTYFKIMHHWSISAIGLLSGLPHIMRMMFAYIFSLFADHLLQAGKIELTNMRKIATSVCNTAQGIAMLGLALFGFNEVAAAIMFTLSIMLQGAVSSGPLAALVDIAPNHAGILLGISSTIDLLPGFISPYIVSCLTYNNQTFAAWQLVYIICAGMAVISGVLYVLYADASLQTWNNAKSAPYYVSSELKPLEAYSANHKIDKTIVYTDT